MKFFNKYSIDFKSIFKKGVKPKDNLFGNYMINGRMGTGKSFFACYLSEQLVNYDTIVTNIHSYKSKNHKMFYFNELNEIYNSDLKQCIFIIDELGKKYTKEMKADKDFYNFLQHSRKMERIVLLIHQEYLQVPNWIRGTITSCFITKKVKFLPFLFITYQGIPVLDEQTLEWKIDYNKWYVYKRTKEVASLYDTMEQVSTL